MTGDSNPRLRSRAVVRTGSITAQRKKTVQISSDVVILYPHNQSGSHPSPPGLPLLILPSSFLILPPPWGSVIRHHRLCRPCVLSFVIINFAAPQILSFVIINFSSPWVSSFALINFAVPRALFCHQSLNFLPYRALLSLVLNVTAPIELHCTFLPDI
jgi:hypothetical protein